MAVLVGLVGIIAYACSVGTSSSAPITNGDGATLPNGTVFSRADLLTAFGDCIVSEIDRFEAKSAVFVQVANAAVADPTDAQISGVQNAWQETIGVWQQLEMMQVGPAGRRTVPGGKDLRKAIYPYPHTDHCEIDRSLTSESYTTNAGDLSVEAQGLWAAEYLLFNTEQGNACDATDEINTSGSWDALDANTMRVRRVEYTSIAANAVHDAALSLQAAWSPNGENFLAELTDAGSGSRTYGKKRVALNAVSDGLGYVEWGIKDNKLARPLGIIGCDNDCAELVEAKYSGSSKLHIRNNMAGFRKIFNGCGSDGQGLGFDDYLYAMGSIRLADQIDRAVQGVFSALDNIEETDLQLALTEDIESVYALHNAVSALSGLMRNDFLVALNLELPQMVQGDND